AVLEAQAAAVGLEDLVAEREPQARAERLRGVERHEGLRELLAGHAATPVRDADRRPAVGRLVDGDADLLLGAPRLPRVREPVDENLLELRGVEESGAGGWFAREAEGEGVGDLLQEFRPGHLPAPRPGEAREVRVP